MLTYVKENVERYVSNAVDAKKLEAEGFKLVPSESVYDTVSDTEEIGAEPVQQRRRRKKEV